MQSAEALDEIPLLQVRLNFVTLKKVMEASTSKKNH